MKTLRNPLEGRAGFDGREGCVVALGAMAGVRSGSGVVLSVCCPVCVVGIFDVHVHGEVCCIINVEDARLASGDE